MIRVILILLVLIVFLLVSALPLLIGEKCVWKNDENRQKEYALQVVKQVLRMMFRLTGEHRFADWHDAIEEYIKGM